MPSATIRTLAAAGAGALVAALVLGAVVLFLRDDDNAPVEVALPTPGAVEEQAPQEAEAAAEVRVYVSGAVRNPGVYALRPGDRLDDALAAAGGPAADAELTAVNLAARVQDEGHYHFPGSLEAESSAPVPPTMAMRAPGTPAAASCGDLIDLNTAPAEILDTLPSIGEVRAAAIVGFREQMGPFQTVEEVTDVSGIGPATYQAIRDLVEVCPGP